MFFFHRMGVVSFRTLHLLGMTSGNDYKHSEVSQIGNIRYMKKDQKVYDSNVNLIENKKTIPKTKQISYIAKRKMC